ncbi:MAG: hypothetical protein K0V04_43805, partial [Deltaproteobacteria bacterium]|nr:hypothetical protein [Deltaproteobacteria bacterium]
MLRPMWRLACASLVLAAIGCGGDSTPTAAPAQPAASAVAEATPAKATPADAKVVAPAVPDAATPLAAVTKTPTDPSDPCSAAAFDLPAGTVIATVNGAPIRSDALGDDAREAER